jgi:phenylacetate-CoA ligase
MELVDPADSIRAGIYRLHWRIRSRFEGFGLTGALTLLADSERWPEERMRDLRDRKLRALVAHAWTAIPHYRLMMEEAGVRPDDVQGVHEIGRLPVMTKDILRQNAAELRARDIADTDLEIGSTGGTTGAPVKYARDRRGTVWQRGCYWRGFGWGGLTLGTRFVQLFGGSLGQSGGRRLNRSKNWFSGKLFLPAFELSPDNVADYVRAIRHAGARYLVGYASSCHALALLTERAGLQLPLTAVFPTAEVLLPQWADDMARVFGAKVLPYYGCGEIQSLGYSCPDASPQVYHAADEHAVIEVERPDGVTGLEGEGAILITDLDNFAMPFIRYRNGDAGVLDRPGCSCGRTLRRITRLDGRVGDVLVTTNGNTISGLIGAHAMRLVDGVEAFQIVQRGPGLAVLRIQRGASYDAPASEAMLRDIFSAPLGPGAVVGFEYVQSIEKSPAGKARYIVRQ